MKLKPLYENILMESLEEQRQFRIESMRKKFNLPDDTVWMIGYHGTSEANARKIGTDKLNKFSWIASDYDTAEQYANMHGGNKPYVMQLRFYIGSCWVSGDYITTEEDLHSTSVGYVPEDLIRKAHELK